MEADNRITWIYG